MRLKIKTTPEDFRVEEELGVPLRGRGPFAVYRLEKRGRAALSLERELAVVLGVPEGALRIPAMKDAVATATQHLSVPGDGPALPERAEGQGYRLWRVGYLDRPLVASDVRGNRFEIVVAEIEPGIRGSFEEELGRLARAGFANWFDSQRFGSWTAAFGFPGKLLLERRFEDVLRAWLVHPAIGDPPEVVRAKAERAPLFETPGKLVEQLPKSHERSIVSFLVAKPGAYRAAVERIQPRLLGLWLSAYQAFLWNRIVATVATAASARPPTRFLALPGAEVPIDVDPPERDGLSFALPSSRSRPRGGAFAEAADRVLAEEGLSWHALKLRGFEKVWLARADRRVRVWPQGLAWRPGSAADEIVVGFALPSGSYATLLLRIAALGCGASLD